MKKYDRIENLSFNERIDILRKAADILADYGYGMAASDLEEIIQEEMEERNEET